MSISRQLSAPALLLLLPLSLGGIAGCTVTSLAITPLTGGERAIANADALTMAATPDAWNHRPPDLADHLTPMWLRLENRTDKAINVTYAAFSLTDERGHRYPVVSPFHTSGSPLEHPEAQGRRRIEVTGVRVASLSPSVPVAPITTRRDVRVARRALSAGGDGFYLAPRVYRRPRVRTYLYYDPWPAPIYYPPSYNTHVYVWSPSGYSGAPSNDVLRLALPEGVIKAGGRVSGFVYFHHAARGPGRLTLRWTARTPKGEPVATLQTAFVIREVQH